MRCALWQVQYPDGERKPCLVPLASLLNHSPHAHVVRYGRLEGGRLALRAMRGCARGRQVLLSYGALPNLKLALFYGFAVPRNPHDRVSFMLSVGPTACAASPAAPLRPRARLWQRDWPSGAAVRPNRYLSSRS